MAPIPMRKKPELSHISIWPGKSRRGEYFTPGCSLCLAVESSKFNWIDRERQDHLGKLGAAVWILPASGPESALPHICSACRAGWDRYGGMARRGCAADADIELD